jgi:hypothetical protein
MTDRIIPVASAIEHRGSFFKNFGDPGTLKLFHSFSVTIPPSGFDCPKYKLVSIMRLVAQEQRRRQISSSLYDM